MIGSINFSSSLWTSASGLNDASTRAATVAHNVANVNTNGFEPDRVHSSALANGGVSTTIDRTYADDGSREALFSNTDLATEMTNLVSAKRAYQANATVLRETNQAFDILFNDKQDKKA